MIIITLGDPLSINIEALAKTLKKEFFFNTKMQKTFVLIGSYVEWQHQCHRLDVKLNNIQAIDSFNGVLPSGLFFYDVSNGYKIPKVRDIHYRAKIACASLKASEMFISFQKQAVLYSCPLDKNLLFCELHKSIGQTEYYEIFFNKKALMIMHSSKLIVGLVTNHLPLKEVTTSITKSLIIQKLQIFYDFFKNIYNIDHPKIAVCGLNPHCGDKGLFGSEDQDIVLTAIECFNKSKGNINVEGPLPADTVFWHASKERYHGVLAMYHDQGLAPIKTLSFFETINISAGLPFLRVSPAHGPASDLFLKNRAEISSFEEALKFACSFTA